jgi:hypothetical protein
MNDAKKETQESGPSEFTKLERRIHAIEKQLERLAKKSPIVVLDVQVQKPPPIELDENGMLAVIVKASQGLYPADRVYAVAYEVPEEPSEENPEPNPDPTDIEEFAIPWVSGTLTFSASIPVPAAPFFKVKAVGVFPDPYDLMEPEIVVPDKTAKLTT